MKRYLIILATVLVLTALTAASCGSMPEGPGAAQPRAAIIDQLYLLEPNPAFIARATAILETDGFAVDLWQGKEITVDFYRELPKHGYKLIIFRVHSGLLLSLEEEGVTPLANTYLFTGETYTTTRYVSEQLTDKVSNALMADDYPLIFAVSSEFIRKDSRGNYDNTIIMAVGCETLYFNDMAAAFIEKGASAYIGWSTLVSLEHTDKVILDLLGNLFTDNLTVAQGTDSTMAKLGRDPYFDAFLKHYPAEIGNQTIAELIK